MGQEARVDIFIRLFTTHETRLRAFATALVHNWADAEEVLQEAYVIVWQKFDTFEIGSNFFAWAGRIVYLTAKDFLKKQSRSKLQFGEAFFEVLAARAIELSDEMTERQSALSQCLGELNSKQRELVSQRYEEYASVESMAAARGQTVQAIYHALSRLRKSLFECVNRRMKRGVMV